MPSNYNIEIDSNCIIFVVFLKSKYLFMKMSKVKSYIDNFERMIINMSL